MNDFTKENCKISPEFELKRNNICLIKEAVIEKMKKEFKFNINYYDSRVNSTNLLFGNSYNEIVERVNTHLMMDKKAIYLNLNVYLIVNLLYGYGFDVINAVDCHIGLLKYYYIKNDDKILTEKLLDYAEIELGKHYFIESLHELSTYIEDKNSKIPICFTNIISDFEENSRRVSAMYVEFDKNDEVMEYLKNHSEETGDLYSKLEKASLLFQIKDQNDKYHMFIGNLIQLDKDLYTLKYEMKHSCERLFNIIYDCLGKDYKYNH